MSQPETSHLRRRTYLFSLQILKMVDDLPTTKQAQIILAQLVRSSTSVGANIVEAKAASSRLEFKKFYEIALKSANETEYWLCLLKDSGFLSQAIIDPVLDELIQISKMLGSSVIKLKEKKF